MVFQSPSKGTLSEAAFKVCSSKKIFIKSYSKLTPLQKNHFRKCFKANKVGDILNCFVCKITKATMNKKKPDIERKSVRYAKDIANSLLFVFRSLRTRVLIANYSQLLVGSCQNFIFVSQIFLKSKLGRVTDANQTTNWLRPKIW